MASQLNVTSTGKDVDGKIEMIFTDGPYDGVSFVISELKFADEENLDGSINMTFEYDITNGKDVDEQFTKTLGDVIIAILEEQVARGEVVYSGGV